MIPHLPSYMPHLNIVIDDTSYANARTKADAHNVYSAILVSNYMYCELIINRRVLIFVDLVVHLNHENLNPTKYNFPIHCCL